MTDAAHPADFAAQVGKLEENPSDITRRGATGAEFARLNLAPERLAERLEEIFHTVTVTCSS
jgi:hypothetical protein